MTIALRWDEPASPPAAGTPTIVLTHGAGSLAWREAPGPLDHETWREAPGPLDHETWREAPEARLQRDEPALETLARGLAAAGLRVARFEFPYMAARRADGRRRPPDRQPVLLDTWRRVVTQLGGGAQLVIGGQSMGGRMASLVADELGARGLVCLGYPFHPPGRPHQLRTAHLAALRTPTLVVQGTRDPFGGPDEVAGSALSPAIRIAWIEDGDHGLAPRRASGRTRAQALSAAADLVAEFVRGLPPAPSLRT